RLAELVDLGDPHAQRGRDPAHGRGPGQTGAVLEVEHGVDGDSGLAGEVAQAPALQAAQAPQRRHRSPSVAARSAPIGQPSAERWESVPLVLAVRRYYVLSTSMFSKVGLALCVAWFGLLLTAAAALAQDVPDPGPPAGGGGGVDLGPLLGGLGGF